MRMLHQRVSQPFHPWRESGKTIQSKPIHTQYPPWSIDPSSTRSHIHPWQTHTIIYSLSSNNSSSSSSSPSFLLIAHHIAPKNTLAESFFQMNSIQKVVNQLFIASVTNSNWWHPVMFWYPSTYVQIHTSSKEEGMKFKFDPLVEKLWLSRWRKGGFLVQARLFLRKGVRNGMGSLSRWKCLK